MPTNTPQLTVEKVRFKTLQTFPWGRQLYLDASEDPDVRFLREPASVTIVKGSYGATFPLDAFECIESKVSYTPREPTPRGDGRRPV